MTKVDDPGTLAHNYSCHKISNVWYNCCMDMENQNMTKGQKMSLWIGIAIPILMVIVISLAVFIPRISTKPTDDFLYTVYDQYEYSRNVWYEVEDSRIVLKERKKVPNTNTSSTYTYTRYEEYTDGVLDKEESTPPDLYVYDSENDTSRKITLDEARKLTLKDATESPNGFSIRRGSYGGGDIFPIYYDSGSYYDLYLVKNTYSKEIHPEVPSDSIDRYTRYFENVGWIIEE